MLATEPPFCGFPDAFVSDSFSSFPHPWMQFYSGDTEICSASLLKHQMFSAGDGGRAEQTLTGLTEVFPAKACHKPAIAFLGEPSKQGWTCGSGH